MGIDAGTARGCGAVAKLLLLKLGYFAANSKLSDDRTSYGSHHGGNKMEQIHVIQQCSPLSHQIASYTKLGNDIHTDESFYISDSAKQSISCGDIMFHAAFNHGMWQLTFHQFHEGRGCRCPQGFEANGAFCGAVLKTQRRKPMNCWQQKHLVSSTRAVGCRHWSISCCICGEITCRNKNWWTTLRWWTKIRSRVRGQFMVKYSILAATTYKFPLSWPIRAKRGASKSLNPGTFFSAWSFSWKRKRWGSFSQKMDKHGLFSQDTWSQKNSTLHCQRNQRILWISQSNLSVACLEHGLLLSKKVQRPAVARCCTTSTHRQKCPGNGQPLSVFSLGCSWWLNQGC